MNVKSSFLILMRFRTCALHVNIFKVVHIQELHIRYRGLTNLNFFFWRKKHHSFHINWNTEKYFRINNGFFLSTTIQTVEKHQIHSMKRIWKKNWWQKKNERKRNFPKCGWIISKCSSLISLWCILYIFIDIFITSISWFNMKWQRTLNGKSIF